VKWLTLPTSHFSYKCIGRIDLFLVRKKDIPKKGSSFKWWIDETERDLFSLNFDRNFRLNEGCFVLINWSRPGATLANCSALWKNFIFIENKFSYLIKYRDLFGIAPVIFVCDGGTFNLVATQ